MPLLRKLADCLGVLYQAPSRSPNIANSISPVADPEVTFGWQGNLFAASGLVNGVVAANTVYAAVPIVEDCFYLIDATATIESNATTNQRIALDILGPTGATAWSLQYAFICALVTAVGYSDIGPLVIPTMRVHLIAGSTVQWRIVDALTANSFMSCSIALRKLYQDQL